MASAATMEQPHDELLELLEVCSVVPARKSEGREDKVELSALDLFWREIHYNLRVVFYETANDGEELDEEEEEGWGRMVEKLKEGLGEVLVDFYPLAGRLAMAADADHPQDDDDESVSKGPRLFIECKDQGVEFVQASIRASFASLKASNFGFQPYFPHLARLGHVTRADSTDLPLLSIQVTRFIGGGIAIGVSHSHVALDGNSLWHFMVSWGERTRGLQLSKPPVHVRPAALRPEKVSQELASLMPFELKPRDERLKALLASKDQVDKVFHFSEEAMKKLKERAMEAQEGYWVGPSWREASALEALLAHCWRRATLARRLDGEAEVSLVVLADWRRRRRGTQGPPPVPRNFVGNAITWTYTSTSACSLLEESFGATLARIMAEVDRCTSLDTLLGTAHWLQLHDTLFQLASCWFPGLTMNVASSPRFPIYGVDFGWGPPSAGRPIRVGTIGEICLFPGHPQRGGGIDLPKEVVGLIFVSGLILHPWSPYHKTLTSSLNLLPKAKVGDLSYYKSKCAECPTVIVAFGFLS